MGGKRHPVSAPRTYVVLCVDDHVPGLVSRKAFLETFGYTVQTVTNGPDALELVSRIPRDVVLLDYHMPGMDGLEVAERLRAGWPDLPVIVLTGIGAVPNRLRELATVCVEKGSPVNQLLRAIHAVLKDSPQELARRRKPPAATASVTEVREHLKRSKGHAQYVSEKSLELKSKLQRPRRPH